MWEWSKGIVSKIEGTECLSRSELHQIEIATRLFEAVATIQSLKEDNSKVVVKPLNTEKFEHKISNWAKDILSKIANANCLNENDLHAVELSLISNDLYNSMLDESLRLDETNWFEFEHSSYQLS